MIDYCTIIRSAPELYVILSPDTTIIDASDAYLAATMVTREDIIGCDLFDIFPDNPDIHGSKGSAALRDSIQTVLKTKQAITMPTIKYDIRRPLSKGGTFETRYWSTAHTPILLAISQEIVKQFASTIEYTSVLNEETVFYFDLPLV